MSGATVMQTDLPLPLVRRGKVRDVYEVDADRLLLVTTDRISAFDVVMQEAIPYKGVVLTQLTAWWLEQLADTLEHHLITADTNAIIAAVPALAPFRATLAGRTMLTRKAEVVPIECVIRGYITGSAWKEYQATGTLAGEALPSGLRESDRLTPPMFSPATKAETGHDENITIGTVVDRVGADTAAELERLARTVYEFGRATAEPRGIILADTKFEFGWRDGRLLLIDEVLTPDSSRFWPADSYEPGRGQPSFDKQPLRDWLDVERKAGRWNGDAPPPTLPSEIIRTTSLRYRDAFFRLTGAALDLAALGLPEDR
ncbi:phosphoribosylaminoimidazolesuccinocarboxamide synthase [Gemmatimonas phototrophica]|uniref:Phosphoribosylaminoimidazole-succinocarboxamide synthase n=1 Tax=Gemmatimonas phototrophica TaxID=1379270 RepID=A0A143BKB6_9BACT|nr:phosphoribosylaminoimidazolesuccinocarboxamide synthase [Gemmatimonas phototrophica]AMW04981.1 phosphoribosylaminoimidazole-succinocarboxamide synthase [Gemmatimonas phototrophica]